MSRPLTMSPHGIVRFTGITPGGGGLAMPNLDGACRKWMSRLAAAPRLPPETWNPAGDPDAPFRESLHARRVRLGSK